MGRILIAEDDAHLREAIAASLTDEGHIVITVGNGSAARDLILRDSFDLVICDVQMPYLNGVELLQWLRNKVRLPFLLMSGHADLVDHRRATDLGATGFLLKPFSNKGLQDSVNALLSPLGDTRPSLR